MIREADAVQGIREGGPCTATGVNGFILPQRLVCIPGKIYLATARAPEYVGRGGAYPGGIGHDLFYGEGISGTGCQSGSSKKE
jgi:hypothetical protein